MCNREQELRKQICSECWSYRSNFQGIDTLMKMENDWYVAQRENDYGFDNCPSNFNCLEDFIGLCENEDNGCDEDLCKSCWRKALIGEL